MHKTQVQSPCLREGCFSAVDATHWETEDCQLPMEYFLLTKKFRQRFVAAGGPGPHGTCYSVKLQWAGRCTRCITQYCTALHSFHCLSWKRNLQFASLPVSFGFLMSSSRSCKEVIDITTHFRAEKVTEQCNCHNITIFPGLTY
jgi:hypothetical protein